MESNKWVESYGEQFYQGLNLAKLKIDECYLFINNRLFEKLYLYGKYSDCFQCPYYLESGPFYKNQVHNVSLNTKFSKLYKLLNLEDSVPYLPEDYIKSNNESILDVDSSNFGEFGVYNVTVSSELNQTHTSKPAVNIYLPIITVCLIYFLLYLLLFIGTFVWNKFKPNLEETSKKERIKSLDTFRGICIVLMIFVNYGHGGYQFLEHAIWNGLYVGDLVFPWFLWIMGACIPISVLSIIKRASSKTKAFFGILKRSCILFVLGLFLGAGSNLKTLRVFGVLQRFAICYLIVATLALYLIDASDNYNETKHQDILRIKYIWLIILVILGVYIYLIFYLETSNCPSAYFGFGGDDLNMKFKNCTGGVTGYIDRLILGNHVYANSLITHMYHAQKFDPEGILGCLTSIFQVFLGLQAGMIVKYNQTSRSRVTRFMFWFLMTSLIGGILCGFSKENGLIPLNKNLWSISFVLVTSGLAYLLLALCYLLVDVVKLWNGKPFLFAGMNPILLYVGHNVTYTNFPFHWKIEGNTHFIALLENIWATTCWVFISYVLYKKKIFLSI